MDINNFKEFVMQGMRNQASNTVSGHLDRTRLIPLTRWDEFHPWPTRSALRHMVVKSGENGFNEVIRRVGKRVLIDEDAFFAWVEQQQGKEQSGGR
jgi:hypothetical protein